MTSRNHFATIGRALLVAAAMALPISFLVVADVQAVKLEYANSGKCLATNGVVGADLLPCAGAPDVQFTGYGQIRLSTGYCLDQSRGGANSQLEWTRCGSPNGRNSQTWGTGDARDRLNNEAGWCAGVSGEMIVAQQCAPKGQPTRSNQRWAVYSGAAAAGIANRAPTLADVQLAVRANGNRLTLGQALEYAARSNGAFGIGDVLRIIGNDGASLIGNDGASFRVMADNRLIGNDGASYHIVNGLISNDGGSLIGNAGGTIASNNTNSLVGNSGGTIASTGSANFGGVRQLQSVPDAAPAQPAAAPKSYPAVSQMMSTEFLSGSRDASSPAVIHAAEVDMPKHGNSVAGLKAYIESDRSVWTWYEQNFGLKHKYELVSQMMSAEFASGDRSPASPAVKHAADVDMPAHGNTVPGLQAYLNSSGVKAWYASNFGVQVAAARPVATPTPVAGAPAPAAPAPSAPAATQVSCADANYAAFFRDLMGRAPNSAAECDINTYKGGKWRNYPDVAAAVNQKMNDAAFISKWMTVAAQLMATNPSAAPVAAPAPTPAPAQPAINLASDARNCGTIGNVCASGTCTNGVCAPVRMTAPAPVAPAPTPVATAPAGPNCSNAMLTAALKANGKGTVVDTGTSGLCNPNRYRGGGSASNQGEWNDLVKQSFYCQDPWIGEIWAEAEQGYRQLDRAPQLCNIRLYNNGSWSSWMQLRQLIQEYHRKNPSA